MHNRNHFQWIHQQKSYSNKYFYFFIFFKQTPPPEKKKKKKWQQEHQEWKVHDWFIWRVLLCLERKKYISICVLALIRCPFHPRFTAVARKRPLLFCQKCRWQATPKHAHTLDPSKSEWADYAAVQSECANLSGNEITRNSSGHTRL